MAKHSKEDNEKKGKDGPVTQVRGEAAERAVSEHFVDWPTEDPDKPKSK